MTFVTSGTAGIAYSAAIWVKLSPRLSDNIFSARGAEGQERFVMQWKPAYSVGIEEIDSQHKELLRLFSIVEEAAGDNQGWSAMHFGLLEVKRFAQFHFRFEEALMRLYGFADYENHAESHGQIVQKMEIVEGNVLRGEARNEVVRFFRDWLVAHIQGTDRSYAQHVLSGAKVVVAKEYLS